MGKKRGRGKQTREVKGKGVEASAQSNKQLSSDQSTKIDALIKNTASLQKIILDLARDTNRLSKDITNMLGLFEDANKAFKEGKAKPIEGLGEGIEEKIDRLAEQNKVVAQALVLLEKFLREKSEETIEERPKALPGYRA